ncbi:MAG: LysE family transporter [Crocinitomicaceae bacterium]|nr:LysE family transporter [Crocinitomicaceae bacterium]
MQEFILTGIGYGLLLSVMIGPAFFILLETSITKGVRAALMFDLGVLLSDLLYLGIAYMFFNQVTALMESDRSYLLRVVGGVLFAVIGTIYIKKKKPTFTKKQLEETSRLSAGNYFMVLLKGFTFNAVNPGVLFYWLTLMSILPEAPHELGLDRSQAIFSYIGVILITFFSIDILKIIGEKKLRQVLTPK